MTPNRTNPAYRRIPSGLSLIELMVALTLGLLLTAGVLQLFNSTKTTFTTNDSLARVQENGRFAIEEIKREFREAGTNGFCAGDLTIRNHLRPGCSNFTDMIYDPNRTLTGFEYDGSGSGDAITLDEIPNAAGEPAGNWTAGSGAGSLNGLPDILQGRVAPGSDVVVIRRMEVASGVTADGNTPVNAASITTSAAHGLRPNEIVLITNCASGADLFQNVQGGGGGGGGGGSGNANTLAKGSGSCSNPGPGNISQNWSTQYDDSMQIFRQRVFAYYVGVDAQGNPGLWRYDISQPTGPQNPMELVQGVESMQMQYGFALPDSLGGDGQHVDNWLDGDEVPDFGLVIAMRVNLVLRSPEHADGNRTAQTFDLGIPGVGAIEVTAPADGRMRHPFSTTVALRNRMIVL